MSTESGERAKTWAEAFLLIFCVIWVGTCCGCPTPHQIAVISRAVQGLEP